jgi:hypothetical protein
MDRLEQLKQKYRNALDTMSQQRVQVSQIGLKGDKLWIQGVAPSQDAKNAGWNAIKAIDSSYSDLECDITVGSSAASSSLHDASPQSLAGGLAQAFRSDQTPPFPQMLSTLFSNSDGQQRAGLLNQLLASAGPGLLASALPALSGILKGGSQITPEQAQQVPTESIQHLAEHAEKSNPSIVDQVSGFYSEHPKVVQALGAGALAMIMSHISKK